MTAAKTLRIDIVSDVVCPWCAIGHRQLVQALADTRTAHTLHWHPFELNPDMPAEGQNLGAHLAEKYGTTPTQSAQNRAHIVAAGAQLGFEFHFSDDMRMHNTFNAHQLLHWAKTSDRDNALQDVLFSAHFTNGQNLNDINVLADLAGKAGLPHEQALAVLADQRFADAVRAEMRHWSQQGIDSVPAVIFDEKYLVSGAQGVENFTDILLQLAAR